MSPTFRFIPTQILLFSFFIISIQAPLSSQERNYAEHVKIARDSWGVPHIFGEKDADVAYGLAWANAEDDFNTMQELLLPAKNLLARWKGKDGAALDFVVQFVGSQKIAKAKYESEISAEFKAYLEGYCAGINDYAASHPKEVKVKKAFPATPIDIIASYHYINALITALQDQLKDAIEGQYDTLAVKFGSNAFAINGRKSTNGNTIMVANPHVKFEGLFSWYEAHLVSEEGMNILGALFHGGVSIFVGTNENLSWSHTWNKYDLVDTYRLLMDNQKKITYTFDGQQKKLNVKKAKLTVKIKKWLPPITVRKKYYESEIGPVIKSKKGEFYALRWGAMEEVKTAEQWWKMNKANSYESFYKVMEANALARFNTVYADKEGNIFYVNGGRVPKRAHDFEWKKVLPGNTSKAIWNQVYPFNELPQLKNPDCGYVFNANNTPLNATCKDDDIEVSPKWDKHMNFRTGNNNRSLRLLELFNTTDRLDFDAIKKIKFDNQYPKSGNFLSSIKIIQTIDVDKYPEYKNLILAMRNWDYKADSTSIAATYFLLTFDYVFNKKKYDDENFLDGIELDETLFVEALSFTKSHLEKYFGTTQVPLKAIQVVKRGNEEYAMPGFPDALAANYSKKRKTDGKYEGFSGDTYTLIVEFDKNAPVRIETLVNYGASAHPESPHYTDQMRLWVKQQTKTMTLDRKEILENAVKIYHPQPVKKSKKR